MNARVRKFVLLTALLKLFVIEDMIQCWAAEKPEVEQPPLPIADSKSETETPGKMVEIDTIIDDILNGDLAVQQAAEKKLEAFEIDELSGIKLLEAAARVPEEKKQDAFGRGEKMIEAAASVKSRKYFAVISEQFSRFDRSGQSAAIDLLVEEGSREALKAVGDILQNSLRDGVFELYPVTERKLSRLESAAELPFVEWLGSIASKDKSTGATVPTIVLEQIRSGWISEERQNNLRPNLELRILQLTNQIGKIPASKGSSWRASEAYAGPSSELEYLVDIYSFGARPPEMKIVDQLLALEDPWLKFWAVKAMLRHKLPVKPAAIEAVAAAPESRTALYDAMLEANEVHAFPSKYKSQQSLAEGALVRWLTYPTELSAVPDEIQFVRVDSRGFFPRKDTYYFKFRTYLPHWAADDGWMLGWSGPFERGKLETHGTDTFSEFEKVQ